MARLLLDCISKWNGFLINKNNLLKMVLLSFLLLSSAFAQIAKELGHLLPSKGMVRIYKGVGDFSSELFVLAEKGNKEQMDEQCKGVQNSPIRVGIQMDSWMTMQVLSSICIPGSPVAKLPEYQLFYRNLRNT